MSLFLVLLLGLSVLTGCGGNTTTQAPGGSATEPASNPAGSAYESTAADTLFAGGTGTAEDPWQIATGEQLDHVRDDLTAHYVLTDDIDLSDFENWMPIGSFQSKSDAPEDAEVPHPDYAFTGTFDCKRFERTGEHWCSPVFERYK